MAETKQFTVPSKLKRRTELVALADWKDDDGNPVVIEVQLIPAHILVPIMKGLPATATEEQQESFKDSLDRLMQWAEPAAEIVKLGDKNGIFSFSDPPEDGKFPWALVGVAQQTEIVGAVLRVSGWSGASDSEAKEFANFRAGD